MKQRAEVINRLAEAVEKLAEAIAQDEPLNYSVARGLKQIAESYKAEVIRDEAINADLINSKVVRTVKA